MDVSVVMLNDYNRLGGAETSFWLTAKSLRDAGVDVREITGEQLGLRRHPTGYVFNFATYWRIRSLLAEQAPAVVHVHNYYHLLSPAVLAATRAWRARDRTRVVVVTAHDFHLVTPNPASLAYNGCYPRIVETSLGWPSLLRSRWDPSRARSVARVIQHMAAYQLLKLRELIDLAIAPSEYMALRLEQAGIPTIVVPNALDFPLLEVNSRSPHNPTIDPSRDEPPLHLVYAGRIEPEKGVANFLRNLPPEIPLTMDILGSGDDEPQCRRAAPEGLHHTIKFHGHVSGDTYWRMLAAADVLVLPSLWPENEPVVLAESLAVGTAVAVSPYGGMREIASKVSQSFQFDPNDPRQVRQFVEDATKALPELRRSDAPPQYLAEKQPMRHAEQVLAAYAEAQQRRAHGDGDVR